MMDSVSQASELKRTRRRKPVVATASKVDRLPPHSPEAEMGVLGCILLSPNECLEEVREKCKSRTDVFYDLRHQKIFEVLLQMQRGLKAIDVITLRQDLKDENLLEQVGGIAYLASLPDAVPSAANLSYYLDIVLEKYRLRKIFHTCTDIVDRVYDYEGAVDEFCDTVRRDMERVFAPQSEHGFDIYPVDELDEFDLDNDPDNLVGNGYCGKGESILVIGASGRGKSSLLMMRVILWALGRDFLGQKPSRPLSFVVWQTENNKRNMAKAFQGAKNYLKIDMFGEAGDLLRKNITFTNCSGIYGREFISQAQSFLLKESRDFAVIDPLISFPEGDLNTAQGAGEFLRKGVTEVSKKTGVAWLINHHTPKPLRDPRATGRKKNVSDYQYSGAGSFDIPGSCRAVETLEEASDGVFRLIISKRSAEAQATHPNGERTSILWLRHATDGGIHWEQTEPPAEPEPSESKGGKPSEKERIAALNLHSFCAECKTEGEGLNSIAKRLEGWLAKQGEDISLTTCKRIVPLIVKNGKLSKGDDCLYRKGKNA